MADNNGIAFTVTSKKNMTYIPAGDGKVEINKVKNNGKSESLKNIISKKRGKK